MKRARGQEDILPVSMYGKSREWIVHFNKALIALYEDL